MNSTPESSRDHTGPPEVYVQLVARPSSAQSVGAGYLNGDATAYSLPSAVAASTGMGELGRSSSDAAHARRDAEIQRMSALLMELNHRVVNSLQLGASMLSLQARRTEDVAARKALQDSAERLQALGLFHREVPASGDVSGAEFRHYLSKLCTELTHATPVDCTVDIEPLELPAEHTKLLALIANELVANALKYAYPEGGRGLLRVSCRGEPGGKVRLMVADSGVGLPAGFDPARSSGLGMTIVRMLTDQIHGRIEIGRDGGTQFSIVVPAPTSVPIGRGSPHRAADAIALPPRR